MNRNKVDKIILSGENAKALDDWWLHIHEGDCHYIPPVMEEGWIVVNATAELLADPRLVSKDMQVYFKHLNQEEIYYEIYRTRMDNHQVEKIMSATKNYKKLQSSMSIKSPNHMGLTKDNAILFFDSVITSHISLMNYMAFYPERVSVEKVRSVVSKKQGNGKKKNVKTVGYQLYQVDFPTEPVTKTEKQTFREVQQTWIVNGEEWKVVSGTKGAGKTLLTKEAKGTEK